MLFSQNFIVLILVLAFAGVLLANLIALVANIGLLIAIKVGRFK